MTKITKERLEKLGWIEKNGVMVRFTNPRIGWKEDGTMIIGWHEHKEKVVSMEELTKLID